MYVSRYRSKLYFVFETLLIFIPVLLRNFLARFAVSRFNLRRMKQKAYAAAGVDIDLGSKVKATLPQLPPSPPRREVPGKVGGLGGLFALDVKKYREPILVSSVDGVGTKLKLAFTLDKNDTDRKSTR